MPTVLNLGVTEKQVTAEEEAVRIKQSNKWLSNLRMEAKVAHNLRVKAHSEAARNFLELIKHHRKHCNSDCSVSLLMLKPIYESLVGRDCTPEEFNYFI